VRAASKQIHASSHPKVNWTSINWKKVKKKVQELQMRIAKAVREEKFRLVKSLQRLLAHSFYGRLWAIRRVVTNKGKTTPGVDGVVWNTPKKKMQAVNLLKRRGYRPFPLRRVYIKKKNGKLRPLSIPTMKDRAMQALYALAMVPVAETTGDPNSYGFLETAVAAQMPLNSAIIVLQSVARHDGFLRPTFKPALIESIINGCSTTS
jgi:RNA-directed DNA polymerase